MALKARRIRLPAPPPAIYPAALERSYSALLLRMVDAVARTCRETMVPVYGSAASQRAAEFRADAWSDVVEAAIARLSLAIDSPLQEGKRAMMRIPRQAIAFGRGAFQRWAQAVMGVRAVQSEFGLDELMNVWARENSDLITSIGRDYLNGVSQRTVQFVTSGRDPRAYAEELRKLHGLTRARAKLIARTEVAKLNSQITEFRQRKIGVQEYTWRTSKDERVRESHKALEGKICRWDDPSVYRDPVLNIWKPRSLIGGFIGHPGRDYQCRCTAEANVLSVLDQLERQAAGG